MGCAWVVIWDLMDILCYKLGHRFLKTLAFLKQCDTIMAPWCRCNKDPQFKTDITRKVGSGRAHEKLPNQLCGTICCCDPLRMREQLKEVLQQRETITEKMLAVTSRVGWTETGKKPVSCESFKSNRLLKHLDAEHIVKLMVDNLFSNYKN